MRIKKIYAVWIYVKDLEQSRKFFEQNFELKVRLRDKEWVEYNLGLTSFALLQRPKSKGPLKPQKTRIMFLVNNIEDWQNHLKKQKVTLIGHIRNLSYGKLLTFQDPNGHWLELFEER